MNAVLHSDGCIGEDGPKVLSARLASEGCYFRGVRNLVLGLLGLLLAINSLKAQSDAAPTTPQLPPAKNGAGASVEEEYRKLLELDDSAQEEVDRLIRENEVFARQGAPAPEGDIRRQIEMHFAPVKQAYDDFLRRNPEHARARLAYGSFLNDIKDEDGAFQQWQKARELAPQNPAAWNNLANYFGHHGPVTNAFVYYAKAIELDAEESVYYHNFGTTVYLFRKDAMEHFKLSEQQVFDKAMALYAKAQALDPNNFLLASDIAQSYYGIRPSRTEDALRAWNYALKLARDDIEREGIYVHLARFKITSGRFDEARQYLNGVTNAMYADLRRRVLRTLEEKEAEARRTNAPPAVLPGN